MPKSRTFFSPCNHGNTHSDGVGLKGSDDDEVNREQRTLGGVGGKVAWLYLGMVMTSAFTLSLSLVGLQHLV